MDIKGKIKDLSTDWVSGQAIVSFTTTASKEELNEAFLSMHGLDLDITFKQHKNRRSLSANAYAWVLIDQIAQKLGNVSKDDLYENYIREYSSFKKDENGNFIVITINASVDVANLIGHWKWIQNNDKGGKIFSNYIMVKGSSEYDSKEMSEFIGHLVTDAKQLGIETLTPIELERMASMWKPARDRI